MNAQEFCYWLQGLFELHNPTTLTEEQTAMVKDHLGLVFKKETPVYDEPVRQRRSEFIPPPVKPRPQWQNERLKKSCNPKCPV